MGVSTRINLGARSVARVLSLLPVVGPHLVLSHSARSMRKSKRARAFQSFRSAYSNHALPIS